MMPCGGYCSTRVGIPHTMFSPPSRSTPKNKKSDSSPWETVVGFPFRSDSGDVLHAYWGHLFRGFVVKLGLL